MKHVAVLSLILATGCLTTFQPEHEELLEAYQKANDYFIGGHYAAAIPLYREVLAKRPRIAEAYVRLADCLRNLGDPAGALAELETGVRVCGRNVVVALPLAREYERQGRTEEAKKLYRALDEPMKN